MITESTYPFITRKEDLLPKLLPVKAVGAVPLSVKFATFSKDPNVKLLFTKLLTNSDLLKDPLKDLVYLKKKLKDGQTNEEVSVPFPADIVVPTCCTAHAQDSKDMINIQNHLLYTSPPATAWKRRRHHIGDSLERQTYMNRHWNERHQYPLRSVTVQWRGHTNSPHAIMQKLSPYGRIENIVMGTGPNAIVVFAFLTDACQVVAQGRIGDDSSEAKLFCQWLHKSLEAKKFYYRHKQLNMVQNPAIRIK